MEILYQDTAITVAVKPPQLLSEQTERGDGFADLLAAQNKNRYVGVIHRLDRGVGGVMVYARTPQAAAKLSSAVQNHLLKKEYLAVIHGEMPDSSGRLCDLLYHDRAKNKTFVVDRERKGVKDAALDYQVVKVIEHPEYGTLSLVRVLLLTGRTHQIRVQFSSRRHPLLGDGKYGAHDACPIALFSHSLTLPHPTSGKPLCFEQQPDGAPWAFFEPIAPNAEASDI